MDIEISTEKTLAKETAKGENFQIPPEESPGVDFCVMIDCTGSMGSYINMSRQKIKDIIKQVNDLYANSVIRTGIVAYRDIQDTQRFEVFQFSEDVEKAKKFLDGLNAEGGGDTPEDINGGFQKALYELKWENPVKIIVHVADAPCHGKKFHTSDDSYPDGHISDMPWDKIFKDLVEMRIDYTFLKVSSITDQMFNLFKEMAEENGAMKFEITFTQDEVNPGGIYNSYRGGGRARGRGGRGRGRGARGRGGHEDAAEGRGAGDAADGFAEIISGKIKGALEKEMRKGLKKKLEKRSEENVELVGKIKDSVKEAVTKIDLKALREKYSDLASKLGACILSTNDFIDALADEDCMCLTFDIGRSQAAIADPTQIIIKSVYPSLLTAGSFFYSTEYALKKNALAHGGFEKTAEGMIVKGAASESITGVMPLYICEENWKVAKLLMKLTLGWDVTLEPAGYTYTQMKTVPFLILSHIARQCHEKPDSEFLKMQYQLVEETCLKIMEEGSKPEFENKFSESVIAQYKKYVEDPLSRTIDVIPSNVVFLTQLHIALKQSSAIIDETYFEAFFKAAIEEELRRFQEPLAEGFNQSEWIMKLINVNRTEHVDRYLESILNPTTITADGEGKKSEYEAKFLAVLNGEDSQKDRRVQKKLERRELDAYEKNISSTDSSAPAKFEIDEVIFKSGDSYNNVQEAAKKEYQGTLKRVIRYIYPLKLLISSKKAENPTNFVEWDIVNDYQFFTLLIQNKTQNKNADRRDAFAGNSYKNPWTEGESFIKALYNKFVESERANDISKYMKNVNKGRASTRAQTFCRTNNLDEAAGALLGVLKGSTFSVYVDVIMSPDFTLPREKLEMMMTGYYKGIQLVLDRPIWNPSKKHCNQIFNAHKDKLPLDDWQKILPNLHPRNADKVDI